MRTKDTVICYIKLSTLQCIKINLELIGQSVIGVQVVKDFSGTGLPVYTAMLLWQQYEGYAGEV